MINLLWIYPLIILNLIKKRKRKRNKFLKNLIKILNLRRNIRINLLLLKHIISKKKIICSKYGKPGHYFSKYKMKNKIKNLKLDADLKSKLLKIVININSSESDSKLEPEICS